MAWRIRIASLHHSDVTVVRHEYIFALIAMLNVNMGAFDMSRSTMHESITDAFAAFSLLEARWRRVDRHHDGMGTKLAHGVSPLLDEDEDEDEDEEVDERTRGGREDEARANAAARSARRRVVSATQCRRDRSLVCVARGRSPESGDAVTASPASC